MPSSNLTASLVIRPANLSQLVNEINSALGRASPTVNVKLNGLEGGRIAQAGSQLATLRKNLDDAGGSLNRFGELAGLANRRFLAFATGAGSVLLVANAFRTVVSEAITFDRTMNKLGQVSGESAQQIKAVQDEITRLATAFGVSSRELSEGALVFKQAGLSALETKTALEALAKSALAPNFDSMKKTAEASIAIMNVFKVKANDLEGALGAVNQVAGDFAVEAGDLNTAIQRAGGAFKQTGGDLNQLLALFTSVRQTTRESAEEIATGLKTIFTRLQRQDTIDALKALNIELRHTEGSFDEFGRSLSGQFVGGYEAIKRVSEGLQGLRTTDPRLAQVEEALGGYRQISRVIPLIQEFATAQKALNSARAGETSLTSASEKAQDALVVKLTKVKEEYLALGRALVDDKGFRSLVEFLSTGAIAAAELVKNLTPLVPLLAGLAAKKALGGAFDFATSFSSPVDQQRNLLAGFFRGANPGRRHVGLYARGGYVEGPEGRDVIPANLTRGEYVINRRAAEQIGYENLDRMNRRGFAQGGRVGMASGGAAGPLARLANRHRIYSEIGLPTLSVTADDPDGGQFGRYVLPGYSVERQLTESERGALRAYSGSAYKSVNSYLRDGAGGPAAARLAGRVASGSGVGRLPGGVSLYRGLSPKGAAALFEGGPTPGQVIADPGVMSFSLDPTTASQYGTGAVLRYRTKAADRGAFLGSRSVSQLLSEQEVVLPPGSKFRVVGVSGSSIDVERLAAGGRVGMADGGLPQDVARLASRMTYRTPEQQSGEKRIRQLFRAAGKRLDVDLSKAYDPESLTYGLPYGRSEDMMAAAMGASSAELKNLTVSSKGFFDRRSRLLFVNPFMKGNKSFTALHELGHGVESRLSPEHSLDTWLDLPEEFVTGRPAFKMTEDANYRKYLLREEEVLADLFASGTLGFPPQDIGGRERIFPRHPKVGRAFAKLLGHSRDVFGGFDAKARYATGGPVSGPEGHDVIKANLTRGEYVINREAAKRIGYDNLDRLNRKGFAEGGPVGFADGGFVSRKRELELRQKFASETITDEEYKELQSYLTRLPASRRRGFNTLGGFEFDPASGAFEGATPAPRLRRSRAGAAGAAERRGLTSAQSAAFNPTDDDLLLPYTGGGLKGLGEQFKVSEAALTKFQKAVLQTATEMGRLPDLLAGKLEVQYQHNPALRGRQLVPKGLADLAGGEFVPLTQKAREDFFLQKRAAPETTKLTPEQEARVATARQRILRETGFEAEKLPDRDQAVVDRVVDKAVRKRAAVEGAALAALAPIGKIPAPSPAVTFPGVPVGGAVPGNPAFYGGVGAYGGPANYPRIVIPGRRGPALPGTPGTAGFLPDKDVFDADFIVKSGRVGPGEPPVPMGGPPQGALTGASYGPLALIRGAAGGAGNAAEYARRVELLRRYPVLGETARVSDVVSERARRLREAQGVPAGGAADSYFRDKAEAEVRKELGRRATGQAAGLFPGSGREFQSFYGASYVDRAFQTDRRILTSGQGDALGSAGAGYLLANRGQDPLGRNRFLGRLFPQISPETSGRITNAFGLAALTGGGLLAERVRPSIDASAAAQLDSRGQGNFVNRSALGNGLQFGLAGAIAGSAFGPVGAGVGGVVGTVVGFASALKESEQEIRRAKIGNALDQLGDRLRDIAQGKTGFEGASAAQGLVNVREARQQSFDKARADATGLTGFDPAAFNAQYKTDFRKNFGPQVGDFNAVLNRYAEDLGKKGNLPDKLEDIGKRIEEGGGGLNKALLEVIAYLRNSSVRTEAERYAQVARDAARSEERKKAGEAVQQDSERAVHAFGRLADLVERANDVFEEFGRRGQSLAARATGEAGNFQLSSRPLEFGNPNQAEFARLAGGAVRGLGPEGESLGEFAQSLNLLKSVGPTALSKALSANPTQPEELASQFARNARAAAGPAGNQVEFRRALDVLANGLRGKELKDVQKAVGAGNVDKVFDEIKAPLDGIEQALQKISAVRTAGGNALLGGYGQYFALSRQREETLGAADSARQNLTRQLAENRAAAEGRPLDVLRDLGPEQLDSAYRARQQRLSAGGFGPAPVQQALGVANAFNPEVLGQRLEGVNGALERAEKGLDAMAEAGGQGTPEFKQAAEEVKRLESQSALLTKALQNLTDVSRRTAGAQERLGAIQRDRESRLGVAERFALASPEQKLELSRGIQYANQANAQGGRALSNDQFALALNALNNLGQARLGGFDGQPIASDLKNKLLKERFGFADVGDQEKGNEAAARKELAEAAQAAAEAAEALAKAQGVALDSFLKELGNLHKTFLDRLATLLKTGFAGAKRAEFGAASEQTRQGEKAAGLAGLLGQFGVKSNADFETVKNNIPALEDISKQNQLSRQVRENFFAASRADFTAGLPGDLGKGKGLGELFAAPGAPRQLGVLPNILEQAGRLTGQTVEFDADKLFRALDAVREQRGVGRLDVGSLPPDQIKGMINEAIGNILRQQGVDKGLEIGQNLQPGTRRALDDQLKPFDVGGLTDNLGKIKEAIEAFKDTGTTLEGAAENARKKRENFEKLDGELRALEAALGARHADEQAPIVGGLGGGGAVGFQIQHRAQGGSVFKPRGTDTVPAMLAPGEFVVNAEATRNNLGLLRQINEGKGPLYRAGGGILDKDRDDWMRSRQELNEAYAKDVAEIESSGRAGYMAPWLVEEEKRRALKELLEGRRQLGLIGEGGPRGEAKGPGEFRGVTNQPIPRGDAGEAGGAAKTSGPDRDLSPYPEHLQGIIRFRRAQAKGKGEAFGQEDVDRVAAEYEAAQKARQAATATGATPRARPVPLTGVDADVEQALRFSRALARGQGRALSPEEEADVVRRARGPAGRRAGGVGLGSVPAAGNVAGDPGREAALAQLDRLMRLPAVGQADLLAAPIERGPAPREVGGDVRADAFRYAAANPSSETAETLFRQNLDRRFNPAQAAASGFGQGGFGGLGAGLRANQTARQAAVDQFFNQREVAGFQRRAGSALVDGGRFLNNARPGFEDQNRLRLGAANRLDFNRQYVDRLSPLYAERGFGASQPQQIPGSGNGFGGGVLGVALGGPAAAAAQARGGVQAPIQPEAIQAMQRMGGVLNEQAPLLVQAFGKFETTATALAEALKAFPAKVAIEGKVQAEVIINGAEALAKLEPALKEMVEQKTNDAIRQLMKEKFPDAGVN
jgi:TP901 family phage tail tape measure protein